DMTYSGASLSLTLPQQSITLLVLPAGTAHQPPVAAAKASPSSGLAPLVVSFDGTGSSDPAGGITTYAWSFGDGTTGSGPTVSHTYTKGGSYTATLTVTDTFGLQASASATCTVTTTPSYAGFVDQASCTTISGWAADRNRLNTSINVEIYDGATLIATAMASNSRPDVGAYLGDNGLHGFSLPTPASLKNGATHAVHVKFESSATELTNSPANLVCGTAAPPNYIGFVDHAACDSISGWAADRSRLGTSINVEVYDGTALIAVMLANVSRPDVGAYLGDNGLHGFTLPTPASLKTRAAHSIHLKFATSATELSGSPASVNCATQTTNYVGYLDHAGCDFLSGWAADRNRLNTVITVSIYDGTTLIATVPANLSRPDVGKSLGDNGLHGFSVPTPAALVTHSAHLVHVKFETGPTADLHNSPASLTCP
ncbi:MAG TPA: PKD domain-containing protein, partial [Blastocatellia bacterium]|nr:PKD domain-containing protein [Blastocatellia bacterium]